MVAHKVKRKEAITQILVGLHPEEITFLDRKVDKGKQDRESRSAIIRWLIRGVMEKPAMLDGK